ncbi:MAG: Rne/Rng family ribonuclease [Alphaproteobacteria bacterium]|nr:Rne/Rng family ribonuclease [Alphaproteobacteria bacterium]
MTMRLLVDAAHKEETRVVVINATRLEDFDYASSTKTQLRGNIYLAKVTRVEPSLQAAFVDYGGNRHGFLAFSEIHPDYYQIPVADREALLAEEAAQQLAEAAEEGREAEDGGDIEAPGGAGDEAGTAPASEARTDDEEGPAQGGDAEAGAEADAEPEEGGEPDLLSADDEAESARRRRARLVRSYKIQEVIKRNQILLVQVVKEERGNKGAALTSYLSLAGRYGVLMPNTARGGGISRRIADAKDRKRLRKIVGDLEVPAGMGLIVRTAGANRSKSEIKRDYDFLLRTWDGVRELTLKSTAPTMVYEEANLIKRAIRDLYSKDIEEVLVEGEEAYKAAKRFMRMLMPSHAKRVQPYRDRVPLFHRYEVEQRFDAMHATEVRLKGGGYIVINPTEALVAIDVNSGRATRERNIENTALRTNLEAAEEVARHLRLRDLGGLIVVDFIDMSENKHNRAVERRLKDALKHDRARLQVGRISSFGLLEMSRQRLRPSLFEASSETCSHCHGTGSIRSRESTALHVLRTIETEGLRKPGGELTVHAPTAVAIYILNQKRASIGDIERRHDLRVIVADDDELVPPDIRIERLGARDGGAEAPEAPEAPTDKVARKDKAPADKPARKDKADKAARDKAPADKAPADKAAAEGDEDGQRGKRRRRGRRGGRRRKRGAEEAETTAVEAADAAGDSAPDGLEAETPAEAVTAPGALAPETPAEAATDDSEPARDEARVPDAARGPASLPDDRREPDAEPEAAREDESAAAASSGAGAPEDDDAPAAEEESAAPSEPAAAHGPEAAPDIAAPGEDEATDPAPAVEDGAEETPQRKARRGWWRQRASG